MYKYINLILVVMCFKLNVCDKTEVLSMKNDLTKSVKKVLVSDVVSVNQTSNFNKTLLHQNNSMILNNNKTVLNKAIVPVEGGGYIHLSTNHSESTIKPEVMTSKPSVSLITSTVHSSSVGITNLNKTDFKNYTSFLSSTVSPEVATERKISARKGVKWEEPIKLNETSTTMKPSTPKVTVPTTRKHKPLFAMIIGDHETKERLSFIESPTTGKDYIFPIVLTIMAVPLLVVIIKLIYKRGSEYTERRHYDRMYLIDGMYNTR